MRFDTQRKLRFLTLYRLTGQLQRSARESGISPHTVRAHVKSDTDFKLAMEEAYGDFKESLESEVMRRAVMGWEEPVYQQGILAGTVRKYDSRLMELLVKRHIPEYKERYEVQHNITGGLVAVPAGSQSVDDWAKANNVEVVEAEIEEQG